MPTRHACWFVNCCLVRQGTDMRFKYLNKQLAGLVVSTLFLSLLSGLAVTNSAQAATAPGSPTSVAATLGNSS
ncbi:MAG: hypothetical protein WCH42_01180, partial [Actinomycetes bacterium]